MTGVQTCALPIFWGGVFAQAEYNTDKWSGFLSASLTEEAYRYDDRGGTDSRYSATGADKLDRVSSLQNFLPWSVKGGFNYKFNDFNFSISIVHD